MDQILNLPSKLTLLILPRGHDHYTYAIGDEDEKVIVELQGIHGHIDMARLFWCSLDFLAIARIVSSTKNAHEIHDKLAILSVAIAETDDVVDKLMGREVDPVGGTLYTSSTPFDVGGYWWKENEKAEPILRNLRKFGNVGKQRLGELTETLFADVRDIGGLWYGPLMPPR